MEASGFAASFFSGNGGEDDAVAPVAATVDEEV